MEKYGLKASLNYCVSRVYTILPLYIIATHGIPSDVVRKITCGELKFDFRIYSVLIGQSFSTWLLSYIRELAHVSVNIAIFPFVVDIHVTLLEHLKLVVSNDLYPF